MAKKIIRKKKEDKQNCECNSGCKCKCRTGCGGVYCLGVIGAAIYYISHATGFWNVVLAILKAIVWPVFLVLKILGM